MQKLSIFEVLKARLCANWNTRDTGSTIMGPKTSIRQPSKLETNKNTDSLSKPP